MSPLNTTQVYDIFKDVLMKLDYYERFSFYFTGKKNGYEIKAVYREPSPQKLYHVYIEPVVPFNMVGIWTEVTITKPKNPSESKIVFKYSETNV